MYSDFIIYLSISYYGSLCMTAHVLFSFGKIENPYDDTYHTSICWYPTLCDNLMIAENPADGHLIHQQRPNQVI